MSRTDWAAIDTVVCDIDGVVVLGRDPIPGAGQALSAMDRAGIQIRFVTNNSTKTREMVAARIADIVGFETAAENIVTSGYATGSHIAGSVRNAFVLGADGLRQTLSEAGIGLVEEWRDADAVVVGLDFELTYQGLVDASLAVQNGAAFFATNVDASYPTPGGLHPGAGSLVAAVATTTATSPIVCGKPYEPMQHALAGFAGERAVMVGDRPETDMALGKAMGWATALVLTGVVDNPDSVAEEYRADVVLDTLADLPELLRCC